MKVVIIGTGFGEVSMAPVYQRLGFETQVISPRDSEAIKIACAGDVDLVSVHSPPFMHLDHVSWALDHQRNVLCDKPFGRNASEARAMRDRAKDLGVLHFLNFEFRCNPVRAKVKALVDEMAIGRLEHASWSVFGAGLRKQPYRWLYDRNLAGGWVGAMGSHSFDTLRWLFDSDIVECSGVCRTETRSRPDKAGVQQPVTTEDAFSAWLKMADGRTANVDTAWSASLFVPQRLLLMGSEGVIEMINDIKIIVRHQDRPEEVFEFPPLAAGGDPHESGLNPWLAQVTEALRTQRQIAPSFDDGVAAAEVMDKIRGHDNLLSAGS